MHYQDSCSKTQILQDELHTKNNISALPADELEVHSPNKCRFIAYSRYILIKHAKNIE